MTNPPLRLAFGAVFWRVFLVTFSIQQFTAFHKTRHVLGHAGFVRKFEAFLDFTPYALLLALLVASLVTVGFDLIIRWVARPIAGVWYAPRQTADHASRMSFARSAGQNKVTELPARLRHGLGWRPGTLRVTNDSVAFIPFGWDREPAMIQRGELREVAIKPSRAVLGSFVLGVPGAVCLQVAGNAPLEFAVAAPERLGGILGALLPTD